MLIKYVHVLDTIEHSELEIKSYVLWNDAWTLSLKDVPSSEFYKGCGLIDDSMIKSLCAGHRLKYALLVKIP